MCLTTGRGISGISVIQTSSTLWTALLANMRLLMVGDLISLRGGTKAITSLPSLASWLLLLVVRLALPVGERRCRTVASSHQLLKPVELRLLLLNELGHPIDQLHKLLPAEYVERWR